MSTVHLSLIVSMLVRQAPPVPAMVGLWEFAPIYGDAADVVAVHRNASATSPLVARLDRVGIAVIGNATASCQWIRDLVRLAAPRGCVFTESGYEIPALAVFNRQGDWLRIALDNAAKQFGWIQDTGGFHALADLLTTDGATYLTSAWDGSVYDSPAAGMRRAKIARTPNVNRPYRAIGHVAVKGQLWLHVELLDEVCRLQEPRVVDTGWVQAQSSAGEQVAWFWSRGC